MHDMQEAEVREFIRHNKFGVLCLTDDARSYGVPIYYGYDGERFYFQTRGGLKQQYLARTREACFTIVRIHSLDDWESVQAFGDIEELEDGLDAMEALMSVPLPPDWGETPRGEPQRSARGMVIYRLTPTRVSGRHSEHATASVEEPELAFGGM